MTFKAIPHLIEIAIEFIKLFYVLIAGFAEIAYASSVLIYDLVLHLSNEQASSGSRTRDNELGDSDDGPESPLIPPDNYLPIALGTIVVVIFLLILYGPEAAFSILLGAIVIASFNYVLYPITTALIREEQRKQLLRVQTGLSTNFQNMSPYEFEEFIAELFGRMGYSTETTKASSDYGADVIAKRNGETTIIQVKRYKEGNNVGNQTVQQTLGAMFRFNAGKSIIVTTSKFTRQAMKQAEGAPIELWDKEKLHSMVERYMIQPFESHHSRKEEVLTRSDSVNSSLMIEDSPNVVTQSEKMEASSLTEGVLVARGYSRTGGWIKYGVSVQNNTKLIITDVTIRIDEFPSALKYEHDGKKAEVELNTINPGESQSAIFRFQPIRCVDANLAGYLRYKDAQGKKHTLSIDAIEIKSICPMLTAEGVTVSDVVDRLTRENLECNKTFIEFQGDGRMVFDLIQTLLGKLLSYDHDWRELDSSYIGYLCYLGKTKYANKYFTAEFLVSGISMDRGGITISVYSDEPAILTGFFHEIVSDLKNHISVLKETSGICVLGCGKCGGPLDVTKIFDGGYIKCEHCDFWNRVPKWKRQG